MNCHLGREVVEVSAEGATGRRFRDASNGVRIQNPNASAGDGQGGAFFSDLGIFDLRAPTTGRVYHLSAMGMLTEVLGQLKYANGVNFDPATRTLYVSEHLARRVLSFTLDGRNRIAANRVLVEFGQVPAREVIRLSAGRARRHCAAARAPSGRRIRRGPSHICSTAAAGT